MMTMVTRHHDFKLLYITESACRVLDADLERINGASAKWLCSCIHHSQLETIIKMADELLTKMEDNEGFYWQSTAHFANVQFTTFKGNINHLMIKIIPMEFKATTIPAMRIFILYDLSGMIKSNHWWIKYNHPEHPHHYHSKENKLQCGHLISSREKEILQLLQKGMSSKSIGKALFISPFTVDNHRRNLLKRIGAVNTTALIHILNICDEL